MTAANAEVVTAAANIKLAVFDVDGVMTDGTLVIGANGEQTKHFNVSDGLGLVMLRDGGIERAIITGRESPAVELRAKQLDIEHVYQGQSDKFIAFETLLQKLALQPTEVCYVGDDLPDIAVMQHVGLPIAVANAHPKLLDYAIYQTHLGGGNGAVREVSDLILAAQGKLDGLIGRYTSGELPPRLHD